MTGRFSAAAPIELISAGQETVGRRRAAEVQEELQIARHEVPERIQLAGHRNLRCHRAFPGIDPGPDTLDRQGGRRLGVPVVEEVPHGQHRMLTHQAQPVARLFVGRQDHLEITVVVHLELVDQAVRGGGDSVHGLQTDVAGGPRFPNSR